MNSMLLVRQFRPAMYASLMRTAAKEGKSLDVPLAQGFTCELCAGLVDKEKPMEEIVREEILEECASCLLAFSTNGCKR
jgi:UDP-sugar diphosphatase